jgi:hypothetical protein
MRLIDADKLVAELQKKPIHDGHFIHTRDVSDAIFNAPTLSPDEVRGVGAWEHQELAPTNWTFCSVCGRHRSKKYKWYYCPNCGARMKGAETDA